MCGTLEISHLQRHLRLQSWAQRLNFWPLYEMKDGNYKFSYEPKSRKPIEEFYSTQGRFKHLFRRDDKDVLLKKIQKEVDDNFARIKVTVEAHQKV